MTHDQAERLIDAIDTATLSLSLGLLAITIVLGAILVAIYPTGKRR